MKVRVISGIFLALALIALIICSGIPYVMNVTMAILSALAVYEVSNAIKCKENKIFAPFCILYAIGYQFIPLTSTKWIFSLIFALAASMFCICIFGYSKGFKFSNSIPLYGMTVFISLCFSTLTALRQDERFGLYYLIMAFIIAWGSDTGGYFFGRWFGKHKMAPHVSPKKTIEGAIGGVFTTTAASLIIGLIASKVTGFDANYFIFALMGLIGGAFAIIGDLSASVIKRNYDVKDFGHLIPGHGGILDRFDSVMFTAPAFYFVKIIADSILETAA